MGIFLNAPLTIYFGRNGSELKEIFLFLIERLGLRLKAAPQVRKMRQVEELQSLGGLDEWEVRGDAFWENRNVRRGSKWDGV